MYKYKVKDTFIFTYYEKKANSALKIKFQPP